MIAESSPEGMLGYTYDSQGRMTSTAVYAAGDDPQIDDPERITFYSYDILGRLVSVTEDSTPTNSTDDLQIETDYTFDLAGRADKTTTTDSESGQSVTTDYDYDVLGRLDNQTDKNATGQTLAAYDYTVRADGKRTSLNETHWFDVDEDGNVDSGEQKSTAYSWTYDPVGRLTDEVIDHWDNDFDQTESYTYDLTGNRTSVERLSQSSPSTTSYRFDANDRLIAELFNDQSPSNADTTTVFDFDHTQQTGNKVYSSLLDDSVLNAIIGTGDDSTQTRLSRESRTYNLQGRLASLTKQSYDNGTPTTRQRSTYQYDANLFRINQLVENWNTTTSQYDLETETEFLVDHHNHTGYAQTQRETITSADGSTKTIDFTYGQDEISQHTVAQNSIGNVTSDETLIFGHDGHGSVRVTYTNTGDIKQVYSYSSYGVRLSIHDAVGNEVAVNDIATAMAYAGEFFDAIAQLSYNRARFYDAITAQWDRLDDFPGNTRDPQSLHKYAYVHGDPVQGVDPTGLMSLGVMIGGALNFAARVGHQATVVGEAYWILTAVTLFGLFDNAASLVLGVNPLTGNDSPVAGRFAAAGLLLLDLPTGGRGGALVKRIVPKNLDFGGLVDFTRKLHYEHVADAPATERAMGTALMFSEELADVVVGNARRADITVAGKGGVGADILAKTADGKTIAREVSVFQGRPTNIYSKIIDEADQIGRGMDAGELDNIAVRDVFLQVSEELAKNTQVHSQMLNSAKNAVRLYADDFGQKLRVAIVDPQGRALFEVVE